MKKPKAVLIQTSNGMTIRCENYNNISGHYRIMMNCTCIGYVRKFMSRDFAWSLSPEACSCTGSFKTIGLAVQGLVDQHKTQRLSLDNAFASIQAKFEYGTLCRALDQAGKLLFVYAQPSVCKNKRCGRLLT